MRPDRNLAAALVFAAVALVIQIRIGIGVHGSDLAGNDDPAHYTTGVMVYDYLHSGGHMAPMAFAYSFYQRFPKVALGHWPPVYYALQAAWYSVFGPSIDSARALSAVICAALALLLFFRLRQDYGPPFAVLGAVSFLTLGAVQQSSWLVMSDLLTGLFAFLAVFAFADFLKSGTARDALWFAGWSVLTILTKGSGWAMGFFMLFAPFLTGKTNRLRSPWYWISGIAIFALAAPFYIYVQIHQIGYQVDLERFAANVLSWGTRFSVLGLMIWFFLPLLIWGIVVLGGLSIYWRPGGEPQQAIDDAATALAWLLAQVGFQLVFDLTRETRYFVPSAALVIILFTRGLWMTWYGVRRWLPRLAFAAPLILVGAGLAMSGLPLPDRITGYQAVAQAIPFGTDSNEMLIASDPVGEGAFIAERLVRDRGRQSVILRASKVLARSNWAGSRYVMLYRTKADMDRYLSDSDIRYILTDDSATPLRPHQLMLEEVLRSDPAKYSLRGALPIDSSSGRRRGNVLVFENRARNSAHAPSVSAPR